MFKPSEVDKGLMDIAANRAFINEVNNQITRTSASFSENEAAIINTSGCTISIYSICGYTNPVTKKSVGEEDSNLLKWYIGSRPDIADPTHTIQLDAPLRSNADGTVYDEINNGKLIRRIDTDGTELLIPTYTNIPMVYFELPLGEIKINPLNTIPPILKFTYPVTNMGMVDKLDADIYNTTKNINDLGERLGDSYTKAEIDIITNNTKGIAKAYTDQQTSEEYLTPTVERIVENGKRSAYNKSFGTSVDTVAEGNHTHFDYDKRLKLITDELGTTSTIPQNENMEYLIEKTPFPSVVTWTPQDIRGGETTYIEDERIQYVANAQYGGYTAPLSLADIAGKTIVLSADIRTPNTQVVLNTRSDADGYSFYKLNNDTASIVQFSIPANIQDCSLTVQYTETPTADPEGPDGKVYVLNLRVYQRNPDLHITSNTQIPDRHYSVWSWESEELVNPEDTAEFMQKFKMNRIYQSMNTGITFNQIADFAKIMNKYSIQINWLTGDPGYALRAGWNGAVGSVERLYRYNCFAPTEARIGTIQLDVEPHALDDWNTNRDAIVEQFMEMYELSYNRALELNLSLSACVSSWFDTIIYDNKYGTGNLYEFICKHSHTTVVMDYSKYGYLEGAKGEIDIAVANKKVISLGLETQPVLEDGSNASETFWELPIEDLYFAYELLFRLNQARVSNENYELLIHSFQSFKKYVAKFPDINYYTPPTPKLEIIQEGYVQKTSTIDFYNGHNEFFTAPDSLIRNYSIQGKTEVQGDGSLKSVGEDEGNKVKYNILTDLLHGYTEDLVEYINMAIPSPAIAKYDAVKDVIIIEDPSADPLGTDNTLNIFSAANFSAINSMVYHITTLKAEQSKLPVDATGDISIVVSHPRVMPDPVFEFPGFADRDTTISIPGEFMSVTLHFPGQIVYLGVSKFYESPAEYLDCKEIQLDAPLRSKEDGVPVFDEITNGKLIRRLSQTGNTLTALADPIITDIDMPELILNKECQYYTQNSVPARLTFDYATTEMGVIKKLDQDVTELYKTINDLKKIIADLVTP